MALSFSHATDSSNGFILLSSNCGTEQQYSPLGSTIQLQNQLSRVKFTYKKKPLIDFTKVPVPTDVENLCLIFDQISLYNQNPPYPPSKVKLSPFSESCVSSPALKSADDSGFGNKYDNSKEPLLFQSPLKGYSPPNTMRKKDPLNKFSKKTVTKLPSGIQK